MSENSEILVETSLKGLVAARVGSATLAQSYSEIIPQIRARCGDDVATLFAEPVAPSKQDPGNPTLTWYTSLDGQMIELTRIDDIARGPVVNLLRTRLTKLKPLLDSPDIGPQIASWLNIPALNSILVVGVNPVLVNWGFLPAEIAESASAREAHFAQTIGRFVPNFSVPPFTPEEQASYANIRIIKRGRRPPTSSRAGESVETGAALAAGSTIVNSSASRWRTPLIACVIAAGIVAFLSWPGVLKYPDNRRDQAAIDRERLTLHEANQTLEAKLRQLEEVSHEQFCRAQNGQLTPLAPGLDGGVQASRQDPSTPLPDRIQIGPPHSGSPVTLEQTLENSVVFVFGVAANDPQDVANGSGFFIAPNLILTNRRVVEGIADGKINVTNKSLGRAMPARLIVKSLPDLDETQGMTRPDLAVLQVEGSHPFMKIGASPAKGADVVSVGYPYSLTHNQPATHRLMEGDATASPDSTYQRGIVITKPDGGPVKEIIHSAQISRGNSGGPLSDTCGRAVGINTLLQRDENASASRAQDSSEIVTFLSAHNLAATIDNSPCTPQIATMPVIPEPGTAGAPRVPTPRH